MRDIFENALDRLHRLSAVCFVDLNHDHRRSILIASSGRSGSTWLAELVNHRNEYRFVFEPFRRDLSRPARGLPYGLYLDPKSRATAEGRVVKALLEGRVRNAWSHRHNKRRIASRRIVKEIRATNLLPWISENLPELPIVYLVRHPVAVAQSWTRMGWRDFLGEFTGQELLMDRLSAHRPVIDEILQAGSSFERHLLRWCLENVLPLADLRPGAAHRVFYEELLANPEAELRSLFEYLGKEFDPAVLQRVDVPSAFSCAGGPARATTDEELARALEVVASFGLDHLYGRDFLPRTRTRVE